MTYVSVGWKTDKATVVARAGVEITQEGLQSALDATGFKVLALARVR